MGKFIAGTWVRDGGLDWCVSPGPFSWSRMEQSSIGMTTKVHILGRVEGAGGAACVRTLTPGVRGGSKEQPEEEDGSLEIAGCHRGKAWRCRVRAPSHLVRRQRHASPGFRRFRLRALPRSLFLSRFSSAISISSLPFLNLPTLRPSSPPLVLFFS